MPKVLLLTAGYGEGHNAAARGLHAALLAAGADAEIVDLFALTGGAFYEKSRRAYLELINRAPKVWAAAFALIDKLPTGALSMPFLGPMRQALAEIIADRKPTAVVSVYPIYGYLVEALYPYSSLRPFAFHTVVTDSITVNSIWHHCPSDTFLVPNEETAVVMMRAGVPEKHLRVFGFPVPPRFARDRPERPVFPPARVLYMINAGKDQAPAVVERLLAMENLHLTVTVGRDEELRAQVEEVATRLGRPVEIHGWTPQMPELLMTHHVLIGKAGGATVQECTAACTPMLMTQVVPGQEEGNAQLLFQNECGALCPTPDALAEKIEELFANDGAQWRQWEKNITRLSRPDAAREIAEFILEGGDEGKVEAKLVALQEEPAAPAAVDLERPSPAKKIPGLVEKGKSGAAKSKAQPAPPAAPVKASAPKPTAKDASKSGKANPAPTKKPSKTPPAKTKSPPAPKGKKKR